MTISTGIAKQTRYKKEATFNTPPGATLAQIVRHIEATFDIDKETYEATEKRSDYQTSDFRHGGRSTNGMLKGELSPKTYSDFFGSALRRIFTAGVSVAAVSVTIATGAVVNGVQQYTVTRAAGSFLTDGFKIADVTRLTVGTLNALNINKNLFIVAMTATVLTVVVLNGSAMFNEGPITGTTVSVIGKKTFAPSTGHTDESYSVEQWYSDNTLSELYGGNKVAVVDVGLPASGMATSDFTFMGPGSILKSNVASYFTSPAAETTTGLTAAANGILYIGGVPVAICTGLSFKIDGGYSGDVVAGSNQKPAIFPGDINITGSFSAFFDGPTFRDVYLDETEMSIAMVLTCDNSASSDFIGFSMSRIKTKNAKRTDGKKGIVLTSEFKALKNFAGGAGISTEATTLSIQDSAA